MWNCSTAAAKIKTSYWPTNCVHVGYYALDAPRMYSIYTNTGGPFINIAKPTMPVVIGSLI